MKRKAKKGFNLEGYIFGALRKIWRWYPERKRALKRQEKNPNRFQCEKCDLLFKRDGVHVDHIEPVVDPKTGFTTWDTYIARLFVKAEGLQILCKPCHKGKTNTENTTRRKK